MQPLVDAVKAAPDLAKAVYSDAVSATLQEVSKIGVDAVKTFRLALFPLQYTSALQDRLSHYIDQAIRKVPADRLVSPQQSLALESCERLRLCAPEELLSRLYVELLARAMDRDRVGEAHPAFIHLISQLAPDEVLVLRQLGKRLTPRPNDRHCVFLRTLENPHRILSKGEVAKIMEGSPAIPDLNKLILALGVEPEELAQPELYATFLEHLISLGVVSYTNMPTNRGSLVAARNHYKEHDLHCVELNSLGELFFSACNATFD